MDSSCEVSEAKRREKVLEENKNEEEESWVVGRKRNNLWRGKTKRNIYVTWAAVNDALIVCHHYCHSPDGGRYQKDTFAIQHVVAASREERDDVLDTSRHPGAAFLRSRLAV